MTAVTVGAAGIPAKVRAAGKGLLARAWAAFIESRMRQAEREIAQHRHLRARQLELTNEWLAPRAEKDLSSAR